MHEHCSSFTWRHLRLLNYPMCLGSWVSQLLCELIVPVLPRSFRLSVSLMWHARAQVGARISILHQTVWEQALYMLCVNAVGSVLLSLLWTVFRWIFKNWFQVFTAKSNAVTCPTGYYIAVLWLFMCVIVASYLGQSFSSLVSLLSFAHCLATKPMAFPKLADAVCKAKRRGVTPSTLGKRWFIVEALKSKYTCMVLKEMIQHCLADSAISVWSKRTWETRAQFVRKVLRNIASFLGRSDCLEVWRGPLIWDNCHVECHMLICVQKNQGLELCLHMLFLKAFCAIGWKSLLSNKMVEHVCLRMQAD